MQYKPGMIFIGSYFEAHVTKVNDRYIFYNLVKNGASEPCDRLKEVFDNEIRDGYIKLKNSKADDLCSKLIAS